MSAILSTLGVLALFVGFFAAGVTLYSLKEGDRYTAVRAGAVLGACVFFYVIAPAGKQSSHWTHCYTDWDARANATVCD